MRVNEDGSKKSVSWRRIAWISAGVFCVLLLILHRPLIFAVAQRIAAHFAARENLKAQFRIEGNPFGSLTLRNVHVFPTGPSDVESIDVDFVHVDYGLFTLIRHGLSSAVKNVEVRSGRIVLNPAKAPLRPRPPNPKHEIKLPDIFPERAKFSGVTVIVRNLPHDFVLDDLQLELNPKQAGELSVGRLQLVGGQLWERLSAQTSYTNRKLVLRDVILANDERIRSVSVDASQIAMRKLTISFDYLAGGGNLSGSIALHEAQESLETKVDLHGANLPLNVINKYAALPEDWIRGQMETLSVDITGLLSSPRTWTGSVATRINDFQQESTTFDRGDIKVTAQNGTANIDSAEFATGKNELHVRGTAELPALVKDFGRTPTKLEISATAPDLAEVTADMPQKVSGSAQVNGNLEIRDSKVNGQFTVAAGGLTSVDGSIDKINAQINLTKTIYPTESSKPWFADLRSEATLNISNIVARDYALDSADMVIHVADDQVTFERALLRRKNNEFSASGTYQLPANPRDLTMQPAVLNLVFNAPELADYWTSETADRIHGPLQMSGQIAWRNGVANGQLQVFGENIRVRDLVVHQLSGQCTVTDSVLYLNDFTATLNQQDYVSANGILDSRAPFRYRGALTANLADLSVFNPLLQAAGNENRMGGSLVVNWSGEGVARGPNNTGSLKLKLERGSFGQLKALESNIDAAYSPEGLKVPIIFLRSDKMDFEAVAETRANTLEVSKIQLTQGTAKYADGFMSIPFIWKNIGTSTSPIPSDGAVSATFQTENLDIKKVFEDIGIKPPASGTVNVKFDASGTLSALNANLAVQLRDVRTDKMPKLEPASIDLTAQARDGQLNITGNVQQPKIQPISLTANLPLQVAEILRERKLPDSTPINAQVRLPRSSVNFVRQFIPEVQELDGDIAVDVAIKGTIAQPLFSGSGDMTVNVGRFANPTLPPLQNFKGRLAFNRDTLNLERFGGELAGGPFTISGRVVFPKLTQPNLDVQVKANSVLVARNDSLTARADADIRVTGPLNSASVSGNVALTNSHFLKNIDLIPIGLPGRPAPEPPASRPPISIPDPPVRDWKFDVSIKTKDPFLIRGSLANGGAIVDLHLGGTGLHPALDGQVRLENVEATLPFSRMEVQYGFLYFDPSDPLNPKLDLHGTSVVRDYTIHVYVFGRTLSPEAVFNSEPPLPQEEIISLLATGTTRQELTGNNNVLAGRAAMLLFQQLYHKVFKKGESTNSSTVFDRLDVDFGQVDPRTGQQTATARFKVNQQIVLVGDIEVGGDFRGMVKYLIRFR